LLDVAAVIRRVPRGQLRSGIMPDERELRAEERRELDGLLPQAYQLVGLDPEPVPAAGVVVRAINDLVGRLRTDAPGGAIELSLTLGFLLGQQWCSEFGWEWRLVTVGRFKGYGVVPADSRFVYFAMQDVYELLVSETEELNLLLIFNMVAAGDVPPASSHEYLSLG
jgi:hypothetical protein